MKDFLNLVFTLIFLFALTFLTISYSQGYRVEFEREGEGLEIKKTGMLAIRSIPSSAKVYINNDDKPVTATNDTIANLTVGTHTVRVEKEGYETWEKTLQVYDEKVTDITAVLILKNPKLDPFTNTEVKDFDLSNNRNTLAYINRSDDDPGVHLLNIGNTNFSILNDLSDGIFLDETYENVPNAPLPSLAESINWGPRDERLLLKINETGYSVYDLTNRQQLPETLTDENIVELQQEWQENFEDKFLINTKQQIAAQEESLPVQELLESRDNNIVWSPDFEKFFTINYEENLPKVVVYNSEEPLPVDEQRLTEPFIFNKNTETNVFWYSDSYHLIITETPTDSEFSRISLIRIDGTNLTQVYNGKLALKKAFPTPSGDRILILTALKDDAPNNIYGIGIR